MPSVPACGLSVVRASSRAVVLVSEQNTKLEMTHAFCFKFLPFLFGLESQNDKTFRATLLVQKNLQIASFSDLLIWHG